MSNKFTSLEMNSWRQFKSVSLDFHPRITIITGPNGTGKSTILSLLNRHFGYQKNYLSTPKKNKKTGVFSFSTGLFGWLSRKREPVPDANNEPIGYLKYSNGQSSQIVVPKADGIQYDIELTGQQTINGIHLDSHRPPSVYRQVPHIPTTPPNKANIAEQLNDELVRFYVEGQSNRGTLFFMKSALISMSIFGHGNQTMEPNQELIDLFSGFEEKLKLILPRSLGFERLIIRTPEVLLDTKSGEFVLDAASGGVIKLFEIAWHLYFYSQASTEFVVTMDEPENHLHPSMQRTFLRDLMPAFPGAQFVVVTHSPFIVSSIKDSNVYVLGYEELSDITEEYSEDEHDAKGVAGARVVSQKLDTVNKAGTTSEILREALGVPTTIPDWAEDRTREIIENFKKVSVSDESLDLMYKQLEDEGLVARFPEALRVITSRND